VVTFAGNTDNCLGIFFHSQKFDDLLDILELVLLRCRHGLAHQRAKLQGFPDSVGGEMQIELLGVASLALKRGVPQRTVDEDIARYNTNGGSRCQDIEKGCLASSGRPLRESVSGQQTQITGHSQDTGGHSQDSVRHIWQTGRPVQDASKPFQNAGRPFEMRGTLP